MARSIVGLYTDPYEWMHACEQVRAKGCKNVEGWAPYPMHGMEESLGIKRSLIGRVVLTMLLTGAFLGFFMQYWMMKVDWPIVIGGKPFNSWLQYVVITFEAGILCGALTNMGLALFTTKCQPTLHTKLWRDDLTDDTFALVIPLSNKNPGEAELRQLLDSQHADEIMITDPEIESERDLAAYERAEAGEAQHA